MPPLLHTKIVARVVSVVLVPWICASGCGAAGRRVTTDPGIERRGPAAVSDEAAPGTAMRLSRTWEDRMVERSFLEGSVLEMRGLLPEAIVRYRSALTYHPWNSAIHYALAKVYRQEGRNDSAMYHAGIAARIDSMNTEAHLLYGQILVDQHHQLAAAEQYECVLRLDPDRIQSRFELARLVADTDPARARYHLEYLQQQVPDDDVVAFALADLCAEAGDTLSGLKALGRLTDADPEFPGYCVATIEYAMTMDDPSPSISAWRTLVAQSRYNRTSEEELVGAVRLFADRVADAPSDGVSTMGRGILDMVKGVAWHSPSGWSATAELSCVLNMLDTAESLAIEAYQTGCPWDDWRRVVERAIEGNHLEWGLHVLKRLQPRGEDRPVIMLASSRLLMLGERFAEAERLVRQSMEDGESADGMALLGWIRFRQNDSEEALRYIQRSTLLGGHSPELFLQRAVVEDAVGDFDASRSDVRRALGSMPSSGIDALLHSMGLRPAEIDGIRRKIDNPANQSDTESGEAP